MNKKLFLFLVFVKTAGSLTAQIPANALTLGGCFGFQSKTEEQQPLIPDIKTNSFGVDLNAIYMFNTHWGGGVTLGYEMEKVEDNNVETRFNALNFGLLGKYQYGLTDRASCYLQPSVVFGSGKEETETFIPITNQTITITDKFSAFSAGIRPGIHYQLKPKWHFDLGLGMLKYETITWKPDPDLNLSDFKESSFGFKLNTKSVRVGVTYVLGGSPVVTR